MSSALAIPGITAVLRHELHVVYNTPPSVLTNVAVSAKAPDVVQNEIGTGSTQHLQVNLFLHQVTLNAAWRNVSLPSMGPDGVTALKNPPLALDLHYLLTAYAFEDSHAEALLGYAVAFLHDNPVLLRGQINAALAALPANTFCDGLRASGLASQIEMIKITPATLGREEMAWLWTALKADYRPTFPFQVSVVLIQSQAPSTSALPVLKRKLDVQPSASSLLPGLTVITPPGGQPAACPGDVVTVQGTNLSKANSVLLTTALQPTRQTITTLTLVNETSFQFQIPPGPPDLPAGIYVVPATVTPQTEAFITNGVPLAIAPKITASPATLTAGGSVHVGISCTPAVRPGQDVALLIGSQQAPADAFTAPTTAPSFTFKPLQATDGQMPLRLRVDGVDSPSIDPNQKPPAFMAPFITVNP